MLNLEQKEEQIAYIQGPIGQLQAKVSGILLSTETLAASLNIGIVCHPHPLYQGSMDNKVVTTIARCWRGLEFATVRFNFRGVGESEGAYGNGYGEIEDLQAILQWVQQKAPNAKIWLAGFSFGAMVSSKLAAKATQNKEQSTIQGLVNIAPAVQFFESLESVPRCPWLIVHGEQDEVVPIELVREWLNKIKVHENFQLVTIPLATHFFHGRLNELKNIIETFTSLYKNQPS